MMLVVLRAFTLRAPRAVVTMGVISFMKLESFRTVFFGGRTCKKLGCVRGCFIFLLLKKSVQKGAEYQSCAAEVNKNCDS